MIEAGAIDEKLIWAASMLANEEEAGFLSLAELEVSLMAETVLLMTGAMSLEVTLA